MEEDRTAGARSLIGWKRQRTLNGIVLTMQLVRTVEDVRTGQIAEMNIALNDRQLRSLARDLTRAAGERGIELFYRPQGWRRFLPFGRRPVL